MRVIRRPSAFESVISTIYRAALDRSLWQEAIVSASDYIGAGGGMIAYHDLRRVPKSQNWLAVGRLCPDLTDLYLRHYVDNPYSRSMGPVPAGIVYAQSSLADPRSVARTAFHADIIAPQQIADLLVVAYARWHRGGTTGGFSFTLDPKAAADIQRRQRRFQQILPHLLRVLDFSAEAEAANAARNSLWALIDTVAGPAMLLDGAGDVVHANPAAEKLLRAGDGLRAVGGTAVGGMRLLAARPAESQLLAAAIGRAVTAAADLEGAGAQGQLSVRIGRPSGRPDLAVCLIPLPVVETAWPGPATIRAALFVLQPDRGGSEADARAAAALGEVYGLTPAEQRVFASVGAGLGLPDTARALGISIETARTHLRRCFDKTGARSQVELARLLALVPAGAPR